MRITKFIKFNQISENIKLLGSQLQAPEHEKKHKKNCCQEKYRLHSLTASLNCFFSFLSLMELALAHFSSLRISAVTSSRSTFSHQTKTPIKPNCMSSDNLLKPSNKFPSFGLYGRRIGFKHASKQRNFIWVCFVFYI